MTLFDWLYLVLFLFVLTLLTKPLGVYICKVLDPEGKTFLDRILKPLENFTYRFAGIDIKKEHDWKGYLFALVGFSFISFVITYGLLAAQSFLPLNPEGLGSISSDLNFNTSASFMTNTNWQSYGGETTMSYFSQMSALTFQNFVSAAVGLVVMAALVRGIARHTTQNLGNFWVDLIRIVYYLLLPLAFVTALLFVSQGVPQNFNPYAHASGLESGMDQVIVQGPIASQEAIKMLGTNGGGYTNVNSAHPYENPTPFSNFLQMLAILLIPAAQTYYLGRSVKNQAHGWSLYIAMTLIFVLGVVVTTFAEMKGSSQFKELGIDVSAGNMEGKESRFGVFGSGLFAVVTTTASNGAVNSMHDSYTPIGGLILMLNMQLGEVIWGGVGSGLYSMLIFVVLSVFIAGLIVGRIPEYLGKRLEAFDVKVSVIAFLPFLCTILGFTAWACMSSLGTSALENEGPHGFSEILYAYSSATANNGSAFAGLSANTPWWNITLGFAMLIGRFSLIVPVLMLAGSFAGKRKLVVGPSSFPVTGVTFIALLICVIVLIGALCFLPALIMGPVLEEFFMNQLRVF